MINLIQGKDQNWNMSGSFVQDGKILLQQPRWEVQHVYRKYNCAAHTLARDALISNLNGMSLDQVPICVMNNVDLDVG